MARDWFSPSEIAAAAGNDLPSTVGGLNKVAARWRRLPGKARRAQGRGGGWEYHISVLPGPVQVRLKLAEVRERPSNALWTAYEALTSAQKQVCAERLAVIERAEALVAAGIGRTAALRVAASEAGIAAATAFGWAARLRGVARADRLAALAPQYETAGRRAEIPAEAWAAFTSDYLRPEAPGLSACYRRVVEAAARERWGTLPHERAFRRRLDAEVKREVQVLARQGREAAKKLYPAQKRSRAHFHAMQAVNADGHKLDVFVRLPDGRIGRVHLMALQDLQSGKILASRLSEAENRETVRLAIGDMVERHGIPEKIWLDNGRAFASKWISGGTPNRYRFKVRDEDPRGLLTTLGVEVHWTNPYSGQSKPIERAFRDLAEEIGKHPFCAGAYTGNAPHAKPENYGNAAIPFAAFRAFVAERIAEHNARPGRRGGNCAGRSFDATFAASLAEPTTIVRWPSAAQRALWLLAAERIRADKGSGEIGLMGGRFWAPELVGFAGQYLTVRFDPENLAAGIRAYDAADRLICAAEAIEAVPFDSAEAAAAHGRKRRQFLKLIAEQKRLHTELDAEALARLYATTREEPEPAAPAVKRLAVAGARQPQWTEEAEQNFAAGLRLVAGRDLE